MQEDGRPFFEHLPDAPFITSADLVDQWVTFARRRDPWRSMPLDDVLGELTGVISVVLREVPWDDHCQPCLLELVARSHGSFRRRQGIAAPALTDESTMLVEAFRVVLENRGASETLADAVIAFLERDLRLVRRATSAGYLDGPSCSRW